jgi:CcmD family protein
MTWKARAGQILIVLMVVSSAGAAIGQQPKQPPASSPSPRPSDPTKPTQPPSAAQEGFVPVDQLPKPQDTMPAAPLVATAYAFVWVVLFGYVISIWRRLSTVERELQSVSRRIGTGGRTP